MRKLTPVIILIVGILIGGAVIYTYASKCPEELPEPPSNEEIFSPQEAAKKVIDFVNQNLLRGSATASLIEVLEENELLYKVRFDIEEQEIESYVTRDGKFFFPEGINLTEVKPPPKEKGQTIGNFSVSEEEICKENGKPIIYFFGSEGCGFCKWEHPVMEKVAAEFKGEISFHNNMDSGADSEVLQKYSTGGIPTLVFGCRYYRVGAGSSYGEEKETDYLTALICKLTGNKPAGVCSPIQDLIDQIE